MLTTATFNIVLSENVHDKVYLWNCTKEIVINNVLHESVHGTGYEANLCRSVIFAVFLIAKILVIYRITRLYLTEVIAA